jgi:hypothetical protein
MVAKVTATIMLMAEYEPLIFIPVLLHNVIKVIACVYQMQLLSNKCLATMLSPWLQYAHGNNIHAYNLK